MRIDDNHSPPPSSLDGVFHREDGEVNIDAIENSDKTKQSSSSHYAQRLFQGFHGSEPFERLWNRLETLERWRELAIRPSEEDCHLEDIDMLHQEVDDYLQLVERCAHVRQVMNDHLPPIEQAMDDVLVAKPSAIPGAGLGLFYEPGISTFSSDDTRDERVVSISQGTVLCFYTGHVHTYHSARHIQDRSYLFVVQGNTLVDPGPCPHIKARYINDPLNESWVNCKYVAEAIPRAAVVATKTIEPGEELFASYGDGYWSQHATIGRRLE
jgi:SET domain